MVYCNNCAKHVGGHRPDDGQLCCNLCGKVLEDYHYSNDPQFVKDAAGFSRAAGNRVNATRDLFSSREATLGRAVEILTRIHDALTIDDFNRDVINTAQRFYEVALDRNFTRGRKLEHVLASCLYLACREKDKPYLLIDFSNHLNVNVYEIGYVYLQLCHVLYLAKKGNIQKLIDPSLYIRKFTNLLLPEENPKVVKTARDIIASMKRDWMQTGRKPSGLCGAALYISALSHGLNFSKSDIIRIVHICEATLTKRLIEFENTDAGGLTIEDLMEKEKDLQASSLMKEASTASKATGKNEALCKHKETEKPFAYGLCRECYDDFLKLSGGLEGGLDPPAFQRAEKERLADSSTEEVSNELSRSSSMSKCEEFKGVGATTEAADHHEVDNAELPEVNCSAEVCDESDTFSDIDDVEVECYLHNDEEMRKKKIIWEGINWEYLQEQAAKEEAAATREAYTGNNNCPDELQAAAALAKKRKEKQQKRAAEEKNSGPAQNPAQAIQNMLSKKRLLTSKLNADALKDLFQESEAAEGLKKQRTETHSDVDTQNGGNGLHDNTAGHQTDNKAPEDGEDGETYDNDLDFAASMDEAYDYDVEDYGYDGL